MRVKICCLTHFTFKIDPHPPPSQILFYSQFTGEEECDAVPDAGTSMWTSRVLSIIIKNMQSYIVAFVWGTAEVFSLFKMKRESGTSKGDPYNRSYDGVSRISASVTPSDGVGTS